MDVMGAPQKEMLTMDTMTKTAQEEMLDVYVINKTVFVHVMRIIREDEYLEMLNLLLKTRDNNRRANMVFDISDLSNVPFTLFCVLQGFGQQAHKQGWNVSFISASNTPANAKAYAVDWDQEPS